MDSPGVYSRKLKKILTKGESDIFKKLNSPQKVQDFLDRMPINFKQTNHSPRLVLKDRNAQCIEGALLAAAIFSYHGRPPLILDLRTIMKDEDHVVALFQEKGHFGAVSKTNHAILRYRDPVYTTLRELVMSYFHEYAMDDGRKTLREHSAAFDLRRYTPQRWVLPEGNLWWLAEDLDNSKHFSMLPKGIGEKSLRKVSPTERKALQIVEWTKK